MPIFDVRGQSRRTRRQESSRIQAQCLPEPMRCFLPVSITGKENDAVSDKFVARTLCSHHLDLWFCLSFNKLLIAVGKGIETKLGDIAEDRHPLLTW